MGLAPTLATLALLGLVGPPDDFERLDGRALRDAAEGPDAEAHEALSLEEIGALPSLLPGTRSALLVVRTGAGNVAAVLVAPGRRRAPGTDGEPVPVLIVERLATFAGPDRQARAEALLLFDGFRLDLDSGHVVPEGQGGDLAFRLGEGGRARLEAAEGTTLYTLAKLPPLPGPPAGRPSTGQAVLPTDFSGRYRLFANGHWTGTLDLEADAAGAVLGTFRSEETGSTYPVTGQVAADAPNKVNFTAKFPRSTLEFEGYLFTEGKAAMAGTALLLDRTFGFYAIRDEAAAPDEARAP